MFKLLFKLVLILGLVAVGVLGYRLYTGDSAEAQEVRDRIDGVLDAGSAWVAKTWDDFRSEKDPEIRELEGRLATLRALRDESQGPRRMQLDQLVRDLERELAEAKQELDSVSESSDEEVRDVAMRHVNELVEDVRQKLDREESGRGGR